MSTHTARSRAKTHRAKKNQRTTGLNPTWIALGVIVLLFGIAIFMTRSDEVSDGARDSAQEYAAVTIEGEALPPFESGGSDAAVGSVLPTISGETFAGDEVSIAGDGQPKVIVLMAHWCPHCQADVRTVQSWIDETGGPQGVDLYTISTWADRTKPNWPASAWLERESWTPVTMVDDRSSSAAAALGLSGTPMYVFVDASGVVQARYSGELPIAQLESMIEAIR